MEKALNYKISLFEAAIKDFSESLEINLSEYPPKVSDTLKSGHVQKFEFCAELMWKTIKAFLYDVNGIDCRSPKQAVKEFYNLSYISPEELEKELQILDDRNLLSHIYNKEQFDQIYKRIIKTVSSFKKVLKEMK